MTTPLETLYNVGKLFMFVGGAMFVWLTFMGQATYWLKDKGLPFSSIPKRHRFLYRLGLWECYFFGGWFVLFIMVALCRVLWRMVTTGW